MQMISSSRIQVSSYQETTLYNSRTEYNGFMKFDSSILTMNKSNISWDQAFKECADSMNKHDLTMKITNELFPRVNGEVWKNWIGLSKDKRELVYTVLAKI